MAAGRRYPHRIARSRFFLRDPGSSSPVVGRRTVGWSGNGVSRCWSMLSAGNRHRPNGRSNGSPQPASLDKVIANRPPHLRLPTSPPVLKPADPAVIARKSWLQTGYRDGGSFARLVAVPGAERSSRTTMAWNPVRPAEMGGHRHGSGPFATPALSATGDIRVWINGYRPAAISHGPYSSSAASRNPGVPQSSKPRAIR